MASAAHDVCADVDALLSQSSVLEVEDVLRAQAQVQLALSVNRETTAALLETCTEAPRSAESDAAAPALLDALATLEAHASRAEESVGEITAEIRWLDTAKRNVGRSIVTLKRLQMLVSSTYHLDQLCASKQYREAATTLQAVQALLSFFESHARVQYVVQLRSHVQELRKQLRQLVMEEYERAFQQVRARWDARDTVLPDAALVVDALGDDTRNALIDWYCTRQLREYRRVFRAVDEAGGLDNVARRYAWFRLLLRTYTDEHAPAFLPAWHIDQRLLALFAEITHDDLKSVLVRMQPRLDVEMLLQALHVTNEFEAQVARQYAVPLSRLVERPISAAFAPYLGAFVDAQERRVAELMTQFAASTATEQAGDEPVRVLLSSTELVSFFRQTLERCAQLGSRAPLRELGALYGRTLRRYAAEVLTPAVRDADVLRTCTVLNTADYIATTCTQLAERVTEKMRAVDAQTAPISFDAERNACTRCVPIHSLTQRYGRCSAALHTHAIHGHRRCLHRARPPRDAVVIT